MQEARKTKIFANVSEVRTLAGAEFGLALINIMFAGVMLLGAGIWQMAIVAAVIHLLLVMLHKYDPKLKRVYMRYMKQGDVYDPFPGFDQKRNARPEGFARNYPC